MDITYDDFKSRLDKKSRRLLTPEIMETINCLCDDEGEEFADIYKTNVLSYMNVMKTGKYTSMDYVKAIKYCSYRLLENSMSDSYKFAFPERYKKLRARYLKAGESEVRIKELVGNFAIAYNKNKVVMSIMEYMQVPDSVLNAPLRQKAINKLASLMNHSRSERIQLDSAKELILATKGPDIAKIELDVNVSNDAVADLQASLGELAMKQKAMLESGSVSLAVLGGLKTKDEFIEAEVG